MALMPLSRKGKGDSGFLGIFTLTPLGGLANQPDMAGDELQGAAGDCNSPGATHAWFDSRVAHHFFSDFRQDQNRAVFLCLYCALGLRRRFDFRNHARPGALLAGFDAMSLTAEAASGSAFSCTDGFPNGRATPQSGLVS